MEKKKTKTTEKVEKVKKVKTVKPEKTGPARIFRSFIGKVTKTAMQKTIVVQVDHMKEHQKYDKNFRVSKKFHVHDEKGLAKVGDKVKFTECRPLSKTKKWFLAEIVK